MQQDTRGDGTDSAASPSAKLAEVRAWCQQEANRQVLAAISYDSANTYLDMMDKMLAAANDSNFTTIDPNNGVQKLMSE